MMRNLVLAIALVSVLPVSARAAGPDPAEAAALQKYCMPDIQRLCPNVPPGGGRIKGCLMSNKDQMSVGCAKALQALKKSRS